MLTEQAVPKMIKMAKLQCCSKVRWKRKLRLPMYCKKNPATLTQKFPSVCTSASPPLTSLSLTFLKEGGRGTQADFSNHSYMYMCAYKSIENWLKNQGKIHPNFFSQRTTITLRYQCTPKLTILLNFSY